MAEQRNNQLLGVSLELLGKARDMADSCKGKAVALIFGHGIDNLSARLADGGAHQVLAVDDPSLLHYRPDLYPALAANLAEKYRPDIFLFGATAVGRDLAPAVAAKLGTGCSADCCDLQLEPGGLLLQIVPAFGGRVMATIITPEHRPQVATVRPGVFTVPEARYIKGSIKKPDVDIPSGRLHLVDAVWARGAEADLGRARVVIAGGAGVKDREGWTLLGKLAEAMGGVLGGTRPAADAGFIAEDRMIGQSGQTIRPDLYFGIGISGDIQHMVGIQDARVIVAINRDPRAPIFKQSDFGITGDYREIIPPLLENLTGITPKG